MNIQSKMAPRTAEQFQDIRQASIQRIVAAGMKLFAKRGYLSVAVKDIAREAGISQGLMYNYFKSKEKLLSYIIDEMINDMAELLKSAHAADSPAERLKLLIQMPFQSLREKKEFWEMVLPILSQQAVSVKVKKQLKELFQSAIVQMEEIFRALKVPKARMEAYKLGAILDGVGWGYFFIFQDSYPLDEIEKKLLSDYENLTGLKLK
jgi:AcrR family transcriptional regulator